MELRPFRSIRFSPKVLKARGLSAVFAPPYDQIGPAKRDVLYAQAPENIVRIITARRTAKTSYAGAAKTLTDWLADGTLEKERRPALWIYRQTFTDGGQTFVRDALVGLVKLAEYEAGVVRPHERTLAKPKADRLALLAATKADLELVFLLTRAPLSAALSTRRVAAADGDRPGRRAPRRVPHLRLRRARRAAGTRQERRVDHRRRPPSLRDGARVLEGSGRREAAGRALQALRDRGHGLARSRRAADSPPALGPARPGIPRSCSRPRARTSTSKSTSARGTPSRPCRSTRASGPRSCSSRRRHGPSC